MTKPIQRAPESGRAEPLPEHADPPTSPGRIGRYRTERVLGKGGFGLVYLAHDEQLNRPVAIKVPHARLVAEADDAEAYLTEARTVANLDHPHIVPVYDVGSTEQFPCFVVSKYIDGSNLQAKVKTSPLSLEECAGLVATVADALHYAHTRGIFHRDIKPGNILLDKVGKPFVADFGLALREQDVGKGPRFAGTPAYMSPEQARGEGHRVDGRSDIFSLGVVFYELLTGRRPFHATTRDELLERIAGLEACPPRQIDDRIPKALERICLKALAKRASERYTTAKDFADELRQFLAGTSAEDKSQLVGRHPHAADAATATPSPLPTPFNLHALKVVPKGLRSFDAADADFFLELLPGPRDREGLPDSIRFWKSRIETADPNGRFSVGLIYGPSGCGKSSLIKAGLLPRLSQAVTALYVEATAQETEAHLVKGLRRELGDLPANWGLVESLAALRQGRFLGSDRKILLVLDQFEQWLHAQRIEETTELVQALRHCDGARLQCVILVRDDFWMAATRFMQALEIRLVEGENSAAVDLFDLLHARKVLSAFGRAYGRLPDNLDQCSREQHAFLDQAVAGLAQNGKVVSVRLALFAEMVKGKQWLPATLKQVGGTQGVGVTFLDETFSAPTAPPAHRLHEKAAQSVLKALLPEAGTDIKGHMHSQQELLQVSGYVGRPKDFDDLIRILDGEVRLITPIESNAESDASLTPRPATLRYYQLTHDYLVNSLTEWLTRKQKQTRRGRAAMRLDEWGALWNSRRDSRYLPPLGEWLNIWLFTHRRDWTAPQQQMIRKAGRHHILRSTAFVIFLLLVGVGSWVLVHAHQQELKQRNVQTLIDRLLESETTQVAGIVAEMAPHRARIDPLLREGFARARENRDARKQLHLSLALLPVDPDQMEYLYQRLLQGDAHEVPVIRQALFDHQDKLKERLWAVSEDQSNDAVLRLRAACALASYDSGNKRWENVSRDVANTLIHKNGFELAQWADYLLPVKKFLLPPLASLLEDERRVDLERLAATRIYAIYANGESQMFEVLEKRLGKEIPADAEESAKVALAKKQANVALALLRMGQYDRFRQVLRQSPDPTVRSYLIHQLAPSRIDPKLLFGHLESESDVSVRIALVLALGEFDMDQLPSDERQPWLAELLQMYRADINSGLHGAVEWVLGRWNQQDKLKEIDNELKTGKIEGARQWFLNREGQSFVIVPRPGQFWMGEGKERHQEEIRRTFAIASKEATLEQFLRFCKARKKEPKKYESFVRSGDCPVNSVTWYEAAEYCNWLSEREGIPQEQWCYLPNEEGFYAKGMKLAPQCLQRTGYRLPTDMEWEFSCRSGTATRFSFGATEELAAKYAWHSLNSNNRSHRIARLKPNELGLFDMHGNAWEWCQAKDKESQPLPLLITDDDRQVLRGGSFNHPVVSVRSADRNFLEPWRFPGNAGFRLAKTVP